MKRYKNLSGESAVVGYEIGDDWIIVGFKDGDVYLYTAQSAGINNLDEMKRLAASGRGLATFISQHVKKRYAKKL